jgi:hypothetical protein
MKMFIYVTEMYCVFFEAQTEFLNNTVRSLQEVHEMNACVAGRFYLPVRLSVTMIKYEKNGWIWMRFGADVMQ